MLLLELVEGGVVNPIRLKTWSGDSHAPKPRIRHLTLPALHPLRETNPAGSCPCTNRHGANNQLPGVGLRRGYPATQEGRRGESPSSRMSRSL